jgi:hypothetical protein
VTNRERNYGMIKLTDSSGHDVYLAPQNISRINEAAMASQWHGVRSIVRTFDGAVIECQQDAIKIAQLASGKDAIEQFRERCIDIVARHGGSVEIEAAIRDEPAFPNTRV